MPQDSVSRLAIIAGRGDLPALLIHAAISQQRNFFILAVQGDTHPEIIAGHPHRWIKMSEIASTLEILQAEHITEVVMAGGLSRPSLKALKPNAMTGKILARIGKSFFGGDDTLLKAIISLFEEEGMKVIGADDLLQDLLTPQGVLTLTQPSLQAQQDSECGVLLMRSIGQLDIGQSIIVCNGQVIGVEALEGTDALIARCGALLEVRGDTYRGVLVKMKKIGQESRVDLPAIGITTVENLARWGFAGIAAEANGSLLIGKEECIALANARQLFIAGV